MSDLPLLLGPAADLSFALDLPLVLGQAVEPAGGARAGGGTAGLLAIYLLAFMGVVTFVLVGSLIFSAGWESYEEKYIAGAERTVEDLFLTIPPQHLLWLSLLGTFVFFVLGFLLTDSGVFGLALGVPGFFSPRLALVIVKRQRIKKFGDQLVDALATLTNALRSGFALPKAFQLIASDMPRPICQEFGILVQEMRLGIEVEDGLENMLGRVPSQDLELMATSIAISNSVGGNLAEVFDRIAFTIRERHRIEGRIDSLTAQGKLQGLLVSLLPFIVGGAMFSIDPTMMDPLLTTTAGWVIIATALVMEGLGFFFVRLVTNIEV